jgi:succinoglycan biosynthesis protein ExoM
VPDTIRKVAVCVVTFRRPHGLTRLLEGLASLEFTRSPAPQLEIVVVDNDSEQTARAVCDELAPRLSWPVRYAHEPQRGISHVRNRAVACVRNWADFIAFIDDDEAPAPGWLDELLYVQAAHAADVVAGPVIRLFEDEAPAWLEQGRFFVDDRYPTGAPIRDPATNNVLIRTSALAGMESPFDPRFAITGGEDTHLFLRLHRAGRKMVWADEALVHEWIPSSRANAKWVLQRIYRGANTWSICERELDPAFRTTAMRVAKGIIRIVYGMLLFPVACLLGRHMVVRSLWYMSFGAGNLTGLAGLRYYEYRVTHGR